jgi:hypothetical protein
LHRWYQIQQALLCAAEIAELIDEKNVHGAGARLAFTAQASTRK